MNMKKRKKVYATFTLGVKYLLCVIDVFAKYVWVKLLIDERAKIVLEDFMNLNESKCKPSKLKWKFYDILMQKWLDDNDILMYSSYNEGRSVVAKRL